MAYISAVVLQHNNDQYINDGVSPGSTQLIPTPMSGGKVIADYYAVPLADDVVSSWNFVVKSTGMAVPEQSEEAVRIECFNNMGQSEGTFYVLGTSAEYLAASKDAECCDVSPAAEMPTRIANVYPCQAMCDNADGFAQGTFGLPHPDGGTYYANGVFNGTALPTVDATTAALLVDALNADGFWNAIGVWSKTNDNLTLIVTSASPANDPADRICVTVSF